MRRIRKKSKHTRVAARIATVLVCPVMLAVCCQADSARAVITEAHPTPTYANDEMKLSTVGSTLYLAGSEKGLGKVGPDGALTPIAGTGGPAAPITPVTDGPDGNPWWIGTLNIRSAAAEHSYYAIYELAPTGATMKVQLPLETGYGAPQSLTAGPDGNLWYPLPTSEPSLDRYTPGGGITGYPLQGGEADPGSITVGADGSLWFTRFWPAGIGRITPSGEITEWPTGTSPYGDPQSLITAPEGAEWFTQSTPQRIARITTTGQVSEFALPNAVASSAIPLAVGPEGAVWFALADKAAKGQGAHVSVGRITPQGAITEYPLPTTGSEASPTSMTLGPEGDLWVAIIDPATLIRINPSAQPAATARSHTGRGGPRSALRSHAGRGGPRSASATRACAVRAAAHPGKCRPKRSARDGSR
jgi:virginiamycin B lyase